MGGAGGRMALSPLTPIQWQSRAGRRECLPSAPLSLTGDSCALEFLLCARRHAGLSPQDAFICSAILLAPWGPTSHTRML